MEEAARLAGGHRWVESRLFEILGGWVATTPEVDAKLLFDRHSQHHAWRAGQWWDRLPVLAGAERDAYVVAPSEGVAAAATDLGGLGGTVARLAGAYRVALPRLAGAYQGHRSAANPASDGAAIRTLDLLLPDVTGDWREGEVLLQGMLVDGAAVEAAAATVARLEGLLVTGQALPSNG
ncbi:MAG TPA: hypothetical protein VGL49_03380 [Acidimicrobiales bacterium]